MHTKKYYTHIDGLRAIAVLAVVFYHASTNWIPGGFVGVDIFFVISGFVVTASVCDFKGNLAQFFSYFYTRRFTRILPALAVCLFLFAVLHALFIPKSGVTVTIIKVLRSALIGLANFTLIRENSDYFSNSAEYNPFTHTWSLSVEEQFYFAFPFLFFLYLKGGKLRWVFTALLATAIGASLTWAYQQENPILDFYSTQGRVWEIGLGVLAFQISQLEIFKNIKQPILKNLFTLVLLAQLLLGIFIASKDTFPSPGTLFSTLSTFLLLILLEASPDLWSSRLLSLSPFRKVGRISYSLYLYHWPVFVLLGWTFGMNTLILKATGILLSFVLAMISFIWIETPVRNIKRTQNLKNWQVILTSLVLIFLLSKTFKYSFKVQYLISLTDAVQRKEEWYPEEISFKTGSCTVPDPKPFLKRVGDCSSDPKLPRIFAVGDSHLGAYIAMMKLLSFESGYEIYFRSVPGCSFINLFEPMNDRIGCTSFYLETQKEILSLAKPGDILFLAGLRVERSTFAYATFQEVEVPNWKKMDSPEAINKRQLAIASAPKELEPFLQKKMRIILEAPKPVFAAPAFRCRDWFNKHHSICKNTLSISRSDFIKYKFPVDRGLQQIANQSPAIHIWDPFTLLCPQNSSDSCSAFKDNYPLFWDQDHLTAYGNRLLLPNFRDFIERIAK